MQVFIPYKSPLRVASCLDSRRLRKQVIECNQILKAISGESIAWKNHPVTIMYSSYTIWLEHYRDCLISYIENNLEKARFFDNLCLTPGIYPWFLDYNDLIIQHRKRLYTKNSNYYSIFSSDGKSDENWYIIGNELLVYVSGKMIRKEVIK